jgi:hypothetical protein
MRSYYRRYHSGGSPYRGSGYAGRWDAAEAAVEAARKREIVNSNINLNPSREGCPGNQQKQKEK